MRSFDLSPLIRSSIGFDHLSRLMDAAARMDDGTSSYPPYNIEKLGEESYRITMAVAGFSSDDLDVTVTDNSLVVTGRAKKDSDNAEFLHRGIAGRSFERRYQLADHIKVTGARLVDGLLHVELAREVPEAKRPRSVAIETKRPEQPKVIDNKAA